MRLKARGHCASDDEADDIVAHALTRAIAEIDGFSCGSYVEPWLLSLLEIEIAARCSVTQH